MHNQIYQLLLLSCTSFVCRTEYQGIWRLSSAIITFLIVWRFVSWYYSKNVVSVGLSVGLLVALCHRDKKGVIITRRIGLLEICANALRDPGMVEHYRVLMQFVTFPRSMHPFADI